MFKNNKNIIYAFAGLLALIVLVQYMLPHPPDWSRNYLSKSKSAFGCYAINSLMAGGIAQNVSISHKTIYQLNASTAPATGLLLVNDDITMGRNDLNALFSYLEKGNSVFIASNFFNGPLADSLHLSTGYSFETFGQNYDSLISQKGEVFQLTAANQKETKYTYPRLLGSTYFTGFDSSRFKVLAVFDRKKACLITCRFGKGQLYLMSVPDVFGNYFIAQHENRNFVYALLSHLNCNRLLWDEHYKTFNPSNTSILKYIIDNDALYSAYLILIFTIVLYMIFEGRRRQKAIPVITAPVNSTLEFVNVISHVYYNSKNHQHIAAEKIKYFYESLRKKFNISTLEISPELTDEIAVLSGIEKTKVQRLFNYCEHLKNTASITEYDLVELNRQIHNFNKNSLR